MGEIVASIIYQVFIYPRAGIIYQMITLFQACVKCFMNIINLFHPCYNPLRQVTLSYYFTFEESEAQRSAETCLNSPSQQDRKLRPRGRSDLPRPSTRCDDSRTRTTTSDSNSGPQSLASERFLLFVFLPTLAPFRERVLLVLLDLF